MNNVCARGRITWLIATMLLMSVFLVGCGQTSPEVKDKGSGTSGEAVVTHDVPTSDGEFITYYLTVKAYENGVTTFDFLRGKKGVGFGTLSDTASLPELPAGKYPDAIAAFAKFTEWEKTCLDKKADLEKDFPNPWGKGKFAGYSTIGSSVQIESSLFRGDDIRAFADLADKEFAGLTEKAREKLKQNKGAGDLLK